MFCLYSAHSYEFILQYFDKEWQYNIVVEYVACLVDETKLHVTSVASVDAKSVVSLERLDDQYVVSKQTFTVANTAQWPNQFVFPVEKVPVTLTAL